MDGKSGKKCSICKRFLPIHNYSPQENGVGYTHSHCKQCNANNKRQYRKEHLLKLRQKDKERYYRDKDKRILLVKQRYSEKKDEINLHRKAYDQTEKGKRIRQQWRDNNKDKIKQKNKVQMNKPENKIRSNISRRILFILKQGKENKKLEMILGYSVGKLKNHLETQFKEGMSWNNYKMNGWHIDHIIPVSAFNFSSYKDKDFHRCFALKNLQPLWAKENLSKSNKLLTPFQPSLKFIGGVISTENQH